MIQFLLARQSFFVRVTLQNVNVLQAKENLVGKDLTFSQLIYRSQTEHNLNGYRSVV